jgi:CBS domain-containing protein
VRIVNVLRAKGSVVATVTPDTPVAVLLAEMVKHRVGAVVVVHGGVEHTCAGPHELADGGRDRSATSWVVVIVSVELRG